jgi:hypothetical protein
LVTYYPAEFKIARENRYIRKICMILVSAVCRPAGHKIFKSTAPVNGKMYSVSLSIMLTRLLFFGIMEINIGEHGH